MCLCGDVGWVGGMIRQGVTSSVCVCVSGGVYMCEGGSGQGMIRLVTCSVGANMYSSTLWCVCIPPS